MNDPNFSFFDVVLPVGSITPFAGEVHSIKDSPPASNPIESYGWMLCDGTSLLASKYPELYTALGGLYGPSPPSEGDVWFKLPDLRGQFLRGISNDDAALENRIAAPGGNSSGVGSTQGDALQTHEHTYTEPTGPPAPGETGAGTATVNKKAKTSIPKDTPNKDTVKVSDYETRPANTFVNYLIKYTYQLPICNQIPNLFQ